MRFRCRIGWHDWSRWQIEGYGWERFFWQKSSDEGSYITLQKRNCKHCGLIETRTIRGHLRR